MQTGNHSCADCGGPAVSFSTGPWFNGRFSPTSDGRFYLCDPCSSQNYREIWMRQKSVVICDIDGTLANIDGREPMTRNPRVLVWDRAEPHVVGLVRAIRASFYPVVFVSGRDECCRAVTEEWLIRNRLAYPEDPPRLLMRADGDRRSDVAVKTEILVWLASGGFWPVFAIDDRPAVIREVWQAHGVPVVQVGRAVGAGGDF